MSTAGSESLPDYTPHDGPPRYVGYGVVPLTIGGSDLPLKAVTQGPQHHSQIDKSLNVAIWATHPLDEKQRGDWRRETETAFRRVSQLQRVLTCRLFMTKDVELLPAVQAHERAQLARASLALETIHGILSSSLVIVSPPEVLEWRRRAATVEPLLEVIARLQKLKAAVNKDLIKNKYRDALKGYYLLLLDLMPWTASPFLFTAEEAFGTGIAELESAVWHNMAVALTGLEQYSAAVTCADMVINMRYTTHSVLCKVYHRKYKALASEGDPEAATARRLSLAIASADPKNGSWAHESCITEHTYCRLKPAI